MAPNPYNCTSIVSNKDIIYKMLNLMFEYKTKKNKNRENSWLEKIQGWLNNMAVMVL